MNIKLSIIVPVYNVEKYVRPCIESIFKQGLDDADFEVIIVNDGTKDRSIEMIADIIQQHNNIVVINQENQGLSVARNNGIAAAQGEYILMPDSDDLLIENSVPILLEKALETKVDLIVADFLKMTNEETALLEANYPPQKEFMMKEKSGQELFLEDLNPNECYVWRTIFKKEFLICNNLKFHPGIIFQDVPFTHECYLKANKCLRISWLLNIYRKRQGAATASFDISKAKDFCIAIAKTWELTHLKELTPTTNKKLRNDIWKSFSLMIFLTCYNIKSASERTQVIDFMRKEAPELNFHDGKKQIIATFLYKNIPHAYVYLRYVYKIIMEDRILPFYRHRLVKKRKEL